MKALACLLAFVAALLWPAAGAFAQDVVSGRGGPPPGAGFYNPQGLETPPDEWVGQNTAFPTCSNPSVPQSSPGCVANAPKGTISVWLYGTWDNFGVTSNLYTLYDSGTLITAPWTAFTGSINGCQPAATPPTCVLTVTALSATTGLPGSMAPGVGDPSGKYDTVTKGQWVYLFTQQGTGHPTSVDQLYVAYNAADGGTYCNGSACTGTGGVGTYALCVGKTACSPIPTSISANASYPLPWTGPMFGVGACETQGTGSGYTAPGFCWSFDNTHGQLNMNNLAGLSNTADKFRPFLSATNANILSGQWNHILISWDNQNGYCAVEINGQNANSEVAGTTGGIDCPALTNSLIVDLNDPTGFGLNANYGTWEGFADLIIKEGVYIGCTGTGAPATVGGYGVTCGAASANTFPPEVIHKFYNPNAAPDRGGPGPVNPGPDCSLPFGSAPELCYKFSPLQAGVTDNAGSATSSFGIYNDAAVSLPLGGPSAGVPVIRPPYGPAGLRPHRPTMRWGIYNRSSTISGGAFSTNIGSLTTCTVSTNCAQIYAGDLLAILAYDTGSTPGAITCPSGWTSGASVYDQVEAMYTGLCYHVATTTDATVPSMGTAYGLYSIGCGTCTSSTKHGWILFDFGNVSAVDTGATGEAASTVTTTGTNIPTLSASTSIAGETVVQCFTNWNINWQSAQYITPPANPYNLLYYVPPGGPSSSYPSMTCAYRYDVPAGTSVATSWGLNKADSAAAITLSLEPN